MNLASPIQIARATIADLDDVAPLFDAYRGFYSQPGDLERGRHFLHQRLLNEESVILLARIRTASATAPAGFTQLYPVFSSVRMVAKWILNDLFVAAPHRRCGVGRLLMEHAARFARDSGAGGIELCTRLDNVSAQRLYESLGYKRDEDFLYYKLNF